MKFYYNNESPDIDNIPAELYKSGGGLLLNKIHGLIKRIWKEKKMPTDWTTNIIVPIYKNRGDKLQCKNCRGISLLPSSLVPPPYRGEEV